VPALNKALPHIVDFATGKPGLYDSEARRIEADLLTTAAEIRCALWMCEQLKLMSRIRAEIGGQDALKFAFDSNHPDVKSTSLYVGPAHY
jgi:hypothetical protein